MEANWSQLSQDLLVETVGRTELYRDMLAFGWVCKPWQLAAAKKLNYKVPSTKMFLMLAPEKRSDRRGFYSIPDGITHKFTLPEANGKKVFSSKGWLITIAKDLSMNLLHPFSRDIIKLPHMKKIKDSKTFTQLNMYMYFITKCALSASPLLTSDYVLMVIYGIKGKLAYFRPGDKVWNVVDICNNVDVTYFKGQFYSINTRGQILVSDIKGDNPTVARIVASFPDGDRYDESSYIVESAGKLLVVFREGVQLRPIREGSWRVENGTYGFQVFEVDVSNNIWTEIKDLGDRALFLGANSSFSIEVPDVSEYKPNSIYFTEDFLENYYRSLKGKCGKDMGIYNMEDESIVPYFNGKSYNRINPPTWVEQSL
ncbi:hypothetical protein QYF36_026185 [Acer negundo]|nr:hypothetical protein QYF36_026185 [Acer negundo]